MRTKLPPSFKQLTNSAKLYGWEQGHETLTLTRHGFHSLIKCILANVKFDEDWYLRTYEDVANAIAENKIESAWQHYVDFGYFEGRLPCGTGFDPEFYAEQYPDVVWSLKSSDARDLLKHYMDHGYAEGRLASPAG
jgi:hypothetical protein